MRQDTTHSSPLYHRVGCDRRVPEECDGGAAKGSAFAAVVRRGLLSHRQADEKRALRTFLRFVPLHAANVAWWVDLARAPQVTNAILRTELLQLRWEETKLRRDLPTMSGQSRWKWSSLPHTRHTGRSMKYRLPVAWGADLGACGCCPAGGVVSGLAVRAAVVCAAGAVGVET